jgi:hypothetical protein
VVIEPTRGSFQVAQENPEPPQPADGGGASGAVEPPTLMLEADITFLTSSLWQDSQDTEVGSVEDTIASNSFPQELHTYSYIGISYTWLLMMIAAARKGY